MVEKIEIVAALYDNVTGQAKKITESVETMRGGIQKTVETTKRWNKQGKLQLTTMVKQTKGLHKFQMEWLGIMFAGMALYRVFGGLIRKQLELFGVMEMFGATMTIVMLPVMEAITPILYKMLEFFMALPSEVKTATGAFILLGAALGLVLMIGGQLMLGINSLLGLLVKFGIIGSASISALGMPLMVIAGSIVGIISLAYLAYTAFEDGFGGIWKILTTTKSYILALAGPLAIFQLITIATVGYVIRYWDKLINVLKEVWGWIKKITSYYMYTAPFGIGLLGSFQTGGVIPATGPYMLHKGETVTPAGATTISTPIYISASVSSDYDVARLTEEISRRMAPMLERLSIGRGSI